MLKSQNELVTNRAGNVRIRLLNTLIIHNFRCVVRIYRRNNQLHVYANIP